ncbi:unnamed protein product [Rhizoctonia solani]|uniref:Uncharacterized protein n=1 Tax=Rhizoctonia solani TaxID=456999 RepID=A0A8H3G911_9AGAM|nr:unnamed protein product [Rhizoctonia solani]
MYDITASLVRPAEGNEDTSVLCKNAVKNFLEMKQCMVEVATLDLCS